MPCCRCSQRKRVARTAFTLLEVIVGLTLMATILVRSLLAFAAHQGERRFADNKIAAVAIADDMLNWMSGTPEGIPAIGRGLVPGKPNWFWQTSIVGATAAANVPLRVIRFTIIEQPTPRRPFRALVTIDLVEPMEAG